MSETAIGLYLLGAANEALWSNNRRRPETGSEIVSYLVAVVFWPVLAGARLAILISFAIRRR